MTEMTEAAAWPNGWKTIGPANLKNSKGRTVFPPDQAAELIVSYLLGDIDAARQEAVRVAIEQAMREWGDLITDHSSPSIRQESEAE